MVKLILRLMGYNMINLLLSILFVLTVYFAGIVTGCLVIYRMYWNSRIKEIESNTETGIDIVK